MYDDDFAENFVWYEWGFVSPADLSEDDSARDNDAPRQQYSRIAESPDVDRPWMT